MAIPEFEGTVPRVTQDQPEFDTNTQAILDYIADDLVPGINEVVEAFNFNSTTGTSTTSNTIGTGSKSFTTQASKSYVGGMFVVIADTAAPSTNSMLAQVTSYNSSTGALVVNVLATLGSGTKTAWTISQTANPVPLDNAVSNASIQAKAVTPAKLSDDAFIVTVGSSKNLVVTNNSGTPNNQVDIDADEIILKDSSGRAYLASAVNLTLDITVSGLGGLRSALSETSSTWYHEFVGWNGSAVVGWLDNSVASPTVPSGVLYWAYVGSIYNDGSSNFIKIYQVGNKVRRAQYSASTSVPGTGYTSISLSAAVPPNAKSVIGQESFSLGASVSATYYLSPTNSDDYAKSTLYTTGGSTATTQSRPMNEPLMTAQTLYVKRTGTAPSTYEMLINGWEI